MLNAGPTTVSLFFVTDGENDRGGLQRSSWKESPSKMQVSLCDSV